MAPERRGKGLVTLARFGRRITECGADGCSNLGNAALRERDASVRVAEHPLPGSSVIQLHSGLPAPLNEEHQNADASYRVRRVTTMTSDLFGLPRRLPAIAPLATVSGEIVLVRVAVVGCLPRAAVLLEAVEKPSVLSYALDAHAQRVSARRTDDAGESVGEWFGNARHGVGVVIVTVIGGGVLVTTTVI